MTNSKDSEARRGSTPPDAVAEAREARLNRGIEKLVKDFIDFNLPPARRPELEAEVPFGIIIRDSSNSLNGLIIIRQEGELRESEIMRAVNKGDDIHLRTGLFFVYTSHEITIEGNVGYDLENGGALSSGGVTVWDRVDLITGEDALTTATTALIDRGFLPKS